MEIALQWPGRAGSIAGPYQPLCRLDRHKSAGFGDQRFGRGLHGGEPSRTGRHRLAMGPDAIRLDRMALRVGTSSRRYFTTGAATGDALDRRETAMKPAAIASKKAEISTTVTITAPVPFNSVSRKS